MKDLIQAIQAHYEASTEFKASLAPGAFSYGRGKQNGDMPYCVCTALESYDGNTFSAKIMNIPIQMNIYTESSTTPTECFDVLEACVDLFENTVLTVTDHYGVLFDKILEIPPKNIGGIKWMAVVSFNCLLQREVIS